MTRAAAPLLLLPCLLLATACQSDEDDARPSPIPPGYARLLREREAQARRLPPRGERGETVDEMLAVVDGEVLTRRELLRQLGPALQDLPPGDLDQAIGLERRRWAQQRLLIAAARRSGMQVPEQEIDRIAKIHMEGLLEAHEEKTGQRLTAERYLEETGQTQGEYRQQVKESLMAEFYLQKLTQGVGPARGTITWEVQPAEVRHLYPLTRERWDLPRAVKVALFQVPIDRFETEGRDFLEAEELARGQADEIARAFRAGEDPEAIARRFRIPRGSWQVSPDWVQRFPHPAAQAFLLDPTRVPRQATVYHDRGGPMVAGVLEVRAGRTRSYEEVYDEIVKRVQQGKRARLVAQFTIGQLQRGSVVWPEELADDLLDDAYELLAEIEKDDVLGRARLK